MILAPFLEKSSPDRTPGWFVDYLFAKKHPNADVLLTTVLGPLRCGVSPLPRAAAACERSRRICSGELVGLSCADSGAGQSKLGSVMH